MPRQLLMIVRKGADDAITGGSAAELVLARWNAIDRDKEPASSGYPLWNGVRESVANG